MILNVNKGLPLINGRAFRCGSFTLPANTTTAFTVEHKLGKVPSATFVWVLNPPYSTNGIIGKFRADSTAEANSVSVASVSNMIGSGSASGRFHLGWDSLNLYLNCDTAYPLLGGLTFQWLVIA